jgi:hypothetical protein
MRVRYWSRTLAWLVVVGVVLELGSRVAVGVSEPVRVDPRYGRLPEPGLATVQSKEGFARARTNELGHFDAPMPATPPPDGILVIGDSFTEARQVATEARFTDRLGARLARRVYNVGHSGWSPLNAIRFLEAERARFAPATTIVQISGSDLADLASPRRLHLAEAADGFAIVPSASDRTRGRGRIARLRAVLAGSAFLDNAFEGALALTSPEDEEGPGAPPCARPDPLAVRALPWVVARLRDVAPDVRLLYLPNLDYHAACTDRCALARSFVVAAALTAGVPLVDPTSSMCAAFARTRQPLHGFWNTVPGTGHLNDAGHAVVADVLAAALGARGGEP